MVDENEVSHWNSALEKIQQLRTTVERNRRKLIESELNVVSTFRDLAVTEADLNNPDHAHRLIEMALHAIRVTRKRLPALPDDIANRVETELDQLQADLLGLRKGLSKTESAESRKTTQRKPPLSTATKRLKSRSPARTSARQRKVRP